MFFVTTAAYETKSGVCRPTEKQWCEIWLRKLTKSLSDHGIDEPQGERVFMVRQAHHERFYVFLLMNCLVTEKR
jgi:hypothetical protein